MVDNGGGINIKGKSVEIRSERIRPAIGNSMNTLLFGPLGKGITIKADKIVLNSKQYSIFSGQGNGKKFEVTLDAQNIDITGTIWGYNGDIFITPSTKGEVNISAPAKGEVSISLSAGSKLTINEDSAELKKTQITGKIEVDGEGTSLLANISQLHHVPACVILYPYPA